MALAKPDECRDCALWGDGVGFVPDRLVPGAPVLAVTMFPSQYEATKGEARIGMTVDDFAKGYERYAGPIEISYANVVRCRGARGVKLPTGKKLKDGARYCRRYDKIPESTKLVVYVGEDVSKHLRPDVHDPLRWRGFQLDPNKGEEITKDEDI